MRGKRNRKKQGFKVGNKLHLKNTVKKCPAISTNKVHYVRVTKEQHTLVCEEGPGVDPATSGGGTRYCLLRPRRSQQSELEEPSVTNDTRYIAKSLCFFILFFFRSEAKTYRLVQIKANEDMWNAIFKEHCDQHPHCSGGKLQWDINSERQKGLCWVEQATCTKCNYKSKPYKLFSEVNTNRRGPKAAAPNVGIHAAMTQTPVGYTSLRKILLASNTPAPSQKGLFKSASKASQKIVEENQRDMKSRRLNLKEINKLREQKDPNIISVEGDAAYNNPIYAGIGKTPFQAATQATYIMAEGTTKNRDIIALCTRSKLCMTGARRKSSCPGTDHECSANIPMSATIGNEQSMAEECINDIVKDGLKISSLTTDPDSGALRAAETLYKKNILKFKPEHFIDTRHLSDNQRKSINKVSFSRTMFQGRTKEIREKNQKKFAHDIVKRCEAEFSASQNKYAGDILMLKRSLSHAKFAIIKCYQKNHTECRKHSLVCTGGKVKNWMNNNCYLPNGFTISPTEEDLSLLHQCLDYRLGPKMLQKTRLGTNTQKVEATNRSLRRSLPRNVTHTTNFAGRAHAAVHSVNHGPGVSIQKLTKTLGAPIVKGTKVATGLSGLQKMSKQQSKYHKSTKAKLARSRKTQYLYDLHDKIKSNQDYKKGKLCPKIVKNKTDHSYAKS